MKTNKPKETSSKQPSDSENWALVLRSDPKAWRNLISRYESLVYTVAMRAGLSLADCADCFQQVWMALFKSRQRIKDPSRLSSWLVTATKREAVRLSIRARAEATDEATIDQPDSSPLPDEQVLQLELQHQLESAITQLDGRCKVLVDMMFFAPESVSYEQIADSLGIAPNSLGPIRQRCLARLKKILLSIGALDVRETESGPL